jgi:hypothetical protein
VPAGFSLADEIERWLGARLGNTITIGGENAERPGLVQPAE